MRDTTTPGTIVKASPESAELRVALEVKTFANVRLRLDASGVLGEIYAKVTGTEEPGAFVIRFTSVDPVAARIIERALAAPGP